MEATLRQLRTNASVTGPISPHDCSSTSLLLNKHRHCSFTFVQRAATHHDACMYPWPSALRAKAEKEKKQILKQNATEMSRCSFHAHVPSTSVRHTTRPTRHYGPSLGMQGPTRKKWFQTPPHDIPSLSTRMTLLRRSVSSPTSKHSNITAVSHAQRPSAAGRR